MVNLVKIVSLVLYMICMVCDIVLAAAALTNGEQIFDIIFLQYIFTLRTIENDKSAIETFLFTFPILDRYPTLEARKLENLFPRVIVVLLIA